MNDVRTIDSHTHILTEEAMRLLAKESPLVAPVVVGRGTPQAALEINGKVVQDPMPAEIWNVDLRLRDMDANDVDVQVLSPTVFTFFYGLDEQVALTAAAIQNEEIAAVVKCHPDRFIGLGTVPLQSPEKAAAELRRGIRNFGLRGAMIGTNVGGRNLDDPTLDPFWAAAEELGAFLFIHPQGGAFGDRLASYYMKNFVGLPFDTTIAAAALIFGGVLERHPRLKICLSHGGGFVPYQAGRFQHAYDVRPEAKPHLPNGPGPSIGRLFYDTILHSRSALEYLVETAGASKVLLGSDYPFDMGNLDCVARVRALSIDNASKNLILGGYAESVLATKTSGAHA
jgi:aminocarboxymuconate-semialdehyde decarboxylase